MVVTTFLWFSVVCYSRFVNIVIGIQFWFRHCQSIETVRHIDRILRALPRFPSPYRFSLVTPAFDTAMNCQCHIKTLQYYCIIYTIICLKSVCLSGHVRRMQFAILDQSSREMSQTDRIDPRYFLSRVRVSIRPRIFLYAEKPQIIVARMLFTSIHFAAR